MVAIKAGKCIRTFKEFFKSVKTKSFPGEPWLYKKTFPEQPVVYVFFLIEVKKYKICPQVPIFFRYY